MLRRDPMDVPEVLAQPTRARLYAALRELRAPATTDDLAHQLEMHPNGVRRHLKRLLDSGLVRRDRLRAGRGRPSDAWSLADSERERLRSREQGSAGDELQGAPRHDAGAEDAAYADLSRWLAQAIPSRPGRREEIEQAGRRIGHELAGGTGRGGREAFLEILRNLGFEPSVEGGGGGSMLCRLGNCPYAESARQNPEIVCGLHKGISTGVLEEVSPEARMSRFDARDPDEAGCLIEVEGLAGSED